jgi:hypothetical protein
MLGGKGSSVRQNYYSRTLQFFTNNLNLTGVYEHISSLGVRKTACPVMGKM